MPITPLHCTCKMLSPTCRAVSSLSPLLRSSFCIILPRFRSPSVLRQFSSATPYPLYYELINYRPDRRIPSRNSNTPSAPAAFKSESSSDPFSPSTGETLDESEPMDRAKRRYYRKRQKRMYGEPASDSDSERRSANEDFVKLRPEIVDFPRLHAREQEIYFYDAFALPWEKDKHYRMVYQLEKKYFPEYSLDKAFVDPATESPRPELQVDAMLKKGKRFLKKNEDEERDDRALMFFDGEKDNQKVERTDGDASEKKVERKDGRRDASEKKVEDFFKLLKKAPNVRDRRDVVATEEYVEPFLSSRRLGLPARWDGPSGTVVLVDKPKGWTSFTVCGKLRRLIKVQKVGHAGTLDPMATGLLIICVGKATKLVESYQGMVKGYSGIFRIGEATSTWDADSPVIQREAWEHIKDEEIRKVAASFRGEIWQVPPMFSAIKVGGERMYDKARRGEMLELSPRRITIFKFDIERSLEDRQNLIFRVSCSKGTYIRSLCADLGKALGSCAHLTSLRRDSIGDYTADDAWSFQDLEAQINKAYL